MSGLKDLNFETDVLVSYLDVENQKAYLQRHISNSKIKTSGLKLNNHLPKKRISKVCH